MSIINSIEELVLRPELLEKQEFVLLLKEVVDYGLSCNDCKWNVPGGEFDNDYCNNKSLSAHLEPGTLTSTDFLCNRIELKDN